MAKIVDVFEVIDNFTDQLQNLEGEVFARKKTESVIKVSTKASYAEDVYVEMFLSVIDSTEDSGEFLLYSDNDDIYTKNRVFNLGNDKGCILYVEFINPVVTGKKTPTSVEKEGVIYDVGVHAGSALYYLQEENGKIEYCPIMRTDLDLSTPETKGAGVLSGMGEMERVEHENYNIYENKDWNRGFFNGEDLLPNSALYLKYFGGNQPNPHFHFMTVRGLIPYIEGWSKNAEETGTPCVNANAISVENLKVYLLDVSEALKSGEMDIINKTLREFDMGLPYLKLLQSNKIQNFKPNFADLSSETLKEKVSLFIPNVSALKGKQLSFKEKSAASLGVEEYIVGKESFAEIIESIPEYNEIKKLLKKNRNPTGVDAMIVELSLAGLFDKLYRIIAVTNFANVSEQENCKRNIKRIISTCMNDVAMPFEGDREKSIWDIYDKGFDNPNIKVNEI